MFPLHGACGVREERKKTHTHEEKKKRGNVADIFLFIQRWRWVLAWRA
jgi:hypothetical protein